MVLSNFREIWLVDFEFQALSGERPTPVCLVALEWRSGQKFKLWRDQFGRSPPYSCASDSLFIAYFASAELGCHLALDWTLPSRILDLYVEFRNLINGAKLVSDRSLPGALIYYGLDAIGVEEKHEMRDLVLRGGPWSEAEKQAILDYCESDVDALDRLLPKMEPSIDLPRALFRGRYMAAVARMEAEGVPIDTGLLTRLHANWTAIQDQLIAAVNSDYSVFEGRTFKLHLFEQYLAQNDIPWPRLESGQLNLGKVTFRDQARSYPQIEPLRQLRHALSELRLNELAVGSDGRNRCLLSPFGARSSRNTPSNSRFIFGPSTWLRSLIQPPPDHGLAYIDWEQQEFGIAAALSGDLNMIAAYQSGDPYLEFARQAGEPNPDSKIRNLYKTCALGVNYGMKEHSLAGRIGRSPIEARALLGRHHETYAEFWRWGETCVNHAMLVGWQETLFGWHKWVFPDPNPRSLLNFHMQANGAEILRLACCLGTEKGVRICAPVHDAVLICAPLRELESSIATMRGCMDEASQVTLDGFILRTDFKTVIHPDHYTDPRGTKMFAQVISLLPQ